MRELLLINGPKRDISFKKGPKDKFHRRFSASLFTRVLPNGEMCDRSWLVYSKELDRVFCFCCKLLRKGNPRGLLVSDGFCDWQHVNFWLKEHETSVEHIRNMIEWNDLCLNLKTNHTIDKVAQELLEKETNRWKHVLVRIIAAVKYFGKKTLSFRGSNEKLNEKKNEIFLGIMDMMAEFDPYIKDHIEHIKNEDMRAHYLGPSIQNELITFLRVQSRLQLLTK